MLNGFFLLFESREIKARVLARVHSVYNSHTPTCIQALKTSAKNTIDIPSIKIPHKTACFRLFPTVTEMPS